MPGAFACPDLAPRRGATPVRLRSGPRLPGAPAGRQSRKEHGHACSAHVERGWRAPHQRVLPDRSGGPGHGERRVLDVPARNGARHRGGTEPARRAGPAPVAPSLVRRRRRCRHPVTHSQHSGGRTREGRPRAVAARPPAGRMEIGGHHDGLARTGGMGRARWRPGGRLGRVVLMHNDHLRGEPPRPRRAIAQCDACEESIKRNARGVWSHAARPNDGHVADPVPETIRQS